MNRRKQLPNIILSLGVASLVATAVLAYARPEASASIGRQEAETSDKPPKIISKVKSLEVLGVTVERRGELSSVVVIEIRNNSDKPIIAVAAESGSDKDASGVSTTGFKGEDEPPVVVLAPRGLLKIRMPYSYVRPGAPIKIGGVMYLDGTEEGDEATLGTLRRQKEHEKKSKKQGASSQQ